MSAQTASQPSRNGASAPGEKYTAWAVVPCCGGAFTAVVSDSLKKSACHATATPARRERVAKGSRLQGSALPLRPARGPHATDSCTPGAATSTATQGSLSPQTNLQENHGHD